MAQITYRGNLSAKSFPFISNNWGRSIIVRQYDNDFSRQLVSQEDTDKDVGIPQVYYMHNVMPFAQGFQSVGYITALTAAADAVIFASRHLLRDEADVKVELGVTTDGKFYTNSGDGTGWIYRATYPVGTITTATVAGTTYLYLAGYGCMRYDSPTTTFVPVTLTGLDPGKVVGITSSFGYLIAWSVPTLATTLEFTTVTADPVITGVSTAGLVINQMVSGTGIAVGSYIISIIANTSVTLSQPATADGTVPLLFAAQSAAIAWSSTIDPTDFTPSLTTGSGGGSVENAQGYITYCVKHTLGFIVYTTNNAVGAVYTNNARYPFAFREIVSSGGLLTLDLLGYDANTGNQYLYSTHGFQLMSMSQSQTVFPDLTDFIAGLSFEDYNEVTDTLTRTALVSQMHKRLNVIADRYFVVSYGNGSLTHAIVYDIALKRYGKLKIPHVDCFEYELGVLTATEFPKRSIAFLQEDGTVKIVDFSARAANSSGVIMLGKFQFVRPRLLQLDTITLENVMDENNFSVIVKSSLDGKTTVDTPTTLLHSAGGSHTYGSRAIGINHSLVIKGNFQLNTNVLQFNIHGKR